MDNDICYSRIGFDYTDRTHTETIICHGQNQSALEAFHSFMHTQTNKTFPEARVLDKSDSRESTRWYHQFDGWLRNVPNAGKEE
jgi:hypothetical protein